MQYKYSAMHIFGTVYVLIALVWAVHSQTTSPETAESEEDYGSLDFSLIKSPTTTPPTTTTTTTTTQNPLDLLNKCYFDQKFCVKKWQCKREHNHSKYIIDLMQDNNCDYLDECCEREHYHNEPFPVSQEVMQCGHAHPTGVFMTIEGDNQGTANFGAYPWTVAIFNEDFEYYCSGALIHHRVVLTTADCTGPSSAKLIARAGEWDMKSDQEILPHQNICVLNKISHEKYDRFGQEYNIALLIMEREFVPFPHIQTACLPTGRTKLLDSECLVTGWQKHSHAPRVLQQTNEMSVSRICATDRNSNLFCAVSQAAGLLYATGSALVCPWVTSENRYSIRGLWISETGNVNITTKFLNVAKFTSWIKETLLKDYNIYLLD